MNVDMNALVRKMTDLRPLMLRLNGESNIDVCRKGADNDDDDYNSVILVFPPVLLSLAMRYSGRL